MIDYKNNNLVKLWFSLDNALNRFEYVTQLSLKTVIPENLEKNKENRIGSCETKTWYRLNYINNRMSLDVISDSVYTRGLFLLLNSIISENDIESLAREKIDFSSYCYEKEYITLNSMKGLKEVENAVYLMASSIKNNNN